MTRRIVEEVPWGIRPVDLTWTCQTPHKAELDPGLADCGLMAWVRGVAAPNARHIYGKQALAGWPAAVGFMLAQTDTPLLYAVIASDGVIPVILFSTRIAVAGEYALLTVGIDRTAGLLRLRVNDEAEDTAALGALGTMANAEAVKIGSNYPATVTAFPGTTINDVLWRKGGIFTLAEIRARYYEGVAPTTPTGMIQIGWAGREGAGTNVASVPPGFNCTMSAAGWTTDTRCKARSTA